MRRNRTAYPPLLHVNRPISHSWKWDVTMQIASSGYVVEMHVSAFTEVEGETLAGTASCSVSIGDDTKEVIECLAVEAMLAAEELNLLGQSNPRRIVFSSNL